MDSVPGNLLYLALPEQRYWIRSSLALPFNLGDSVEMMNSVKEVKNYLGFYFNSTHT